MSVSKEEKKTIYKLDIRGALDFNDGFRFGAGFICGVSIVILIATIIQTAINWIK